LNHWALQSQVLLAAILSLPGRHAAAQDPYLGRWQTLHARQTGAVSFQISAAKSQYYSGELIPVQLSFTSTQPKTFLADTRLQDRVGRMNGVEEFLIDPAALTEDPLRGLPGENGGMGGLSGGPCVLSDKPFTFERVLNEWVRFRKPGKYRIAILSRRVVQVDPTRSEYYLQTHPGEGTRQELVSNILTLNIVPAPAAWVKQQIAEAVGVMDAPTDPRQDAQPRLLRAGSTLRFLDSPEAALELARHLGSGDNVDSWALHMGVLGSPYRKQLLPMLEARLVAPDQPVWDRYLDTLTRLSELVGAGQTRKEYVARLIASLPAKQPAARVISINTLLESARRDSSDTSWVAPLAASIVTDFRNLPLNLQTNLLLSRWSIIGNPAMLPILREISTDPLEPQGARNIAVRRIYELAPEEGRRIILSQLAAPNTYLSFSTLEMLPDRSLPELNDLLASRAEAGQVEDALILRYATGDIVRRVEQAYLKRNAEFDRQKLPHCGGPLIYYFLQQDPAFGEKELRNDIDKPGAFPACYDIGFQFQSLDRNAYSPALERLAIEFLTSDKVPVKRGAAEVLGKYGSPAAEKPLWYALEYFRSWWKGREQELEDVNGRESMQFERALRIALAQADGWTMQADGLNGLLALCSSNWCRQEVREWLAHAASPVAIEIVSGPEGFHAAIAQYAADSEVQMRRKIGQFPAGTVFRVAPLTGGEQAGQIVRALGYSLASQ
jgi:HEAT repeat protein